MPQIEQIIGWASATLLVATIATQIARQWREGTSAGVSRFLFIGQFAASTGLAVYSFMGDQWVFLSLNIAMASAAVVGLGLCLFHARKQAGAVVPVRDPAAET